MESSSLKTPRARRGPYRCNKRTPRQTRFNRSHRKNVGGHCHKVSTNSSGNNYEMNHEEVSPETSANSGMRDHEEVSLETSTTSYLNNHEMDHEEISEHFTAGVLADDNQRIKHSEEKLYPGSILTQTTSNLAIRSYISRHHLSRQAQEDLLQLLNLHTPAPGLFPTCLHTFKKNSRKDDDGSVNQIYHYFCPRCHTNLSDNNVNVCHNDLCGVPLSEEQIQSFFTLSIADQFRNLLKRPKLYKLLQDKKKKIRKQGLLTDIDDGQLYKALDNILCDQSLATKERLMLSVVLNTDGVAVFKSTNCSVWLVLLMVNELPFIERKQPKNMILAGLWYSNEKPNMQMFLKPIVEELSMLETSGLEVHTLGSKRPLHVTVHVICCSCDLPARAIVQNFNQFNGAYGCGYCEQPGSSFRTEKGGNVHVFSYDCNLPKGPPRTQESSIEYAKRAIKDHVVIKGVKGPSWLSRLKSFNLIKGMSVEYMHCALLGVSKLLLGLWTDTARCPDTCHDLRSAIPQIDKLIDTIRVPSSIRRKPRGISDMKHWKASEFRSWTLFYAIPVLKGILHENYYQHFILFSEALWLLLQFAPSLEDIAEAERLLQLFCFKFAAYYGERYYTANIHMLLHFADSVRDLGPLWAHSAFPFEDTNGWLGDLFYGTRDPHKQIIRAFSERQALSLTAEDVLCNSDEGDDLKGFLDQTLCTGQRYQVTADLGQGHLVLGKFSSCAELTKEDVESIKEILQNVNMNKGIVYNRVMINGIMYKSTNYQRNSAANDHIFCFKEGNEKIVGSALKYISVCNVDCMTCLSPCQHVAIVDSLPILECQIFTDTIRGTTSKHHHRVSSSSSSIKVCHTSSIFSKCVTMELDCSEKFISEIPNCKENNL